VTIFNYPKDIKPFYMRQNDDGKTAAAMDVLVPGIGEIVGGSQREERLDVLRRPDGQQNLDPANYSWYPTSAATAPSRTPVTASASSACSCLSQACPTSAMSFPLPARRGMRILSNDECRAEQSETDCRRQPAGKRSASMPNAEWSEPPLVGARGFTFVIRHSSFVIWTNGSSNSARL
jgi:hypothetical protein